MKLTPTKIKRLPDGDHIDSAGLYLQIRGQSRSWLYRYQLAGRTRKMGLGPYPAISLADARRLRDEVAKKKALGIDPLEDRKVIRSMTVKEAVGATFEALKGDLKGDGKAGRWMSPLETLVLPKLGNREVASLTQLDIVDTLRPVWRSKTSASEKAIQRLGIAIRHAKAAGIDVDVGIIANAKIMLGSQGHKPKHIPSMPHAEIPAFYASLGDSAGDSALKLLILTASRSTPIRFAHPDQFDLKGMIWTIPGELMKTARGKEENFRIPLPSEALELVEGHQGLLFPGRSGKPMSDMTLSAIIRRRDLPFRPHGFRASFRSWADDTGVDWSVAESCLAHKVGSKASRAYRRSDMLERRRPVMEAWAEHVTGAEVGRVVQLAT